MWSWRVGSIRGIDLKIHLTFPLILIWAAFQFGAGRENSLPYALFGALLVMLLFGCVLLHELGHALVARRYGIPVEDITLLPIGGLARFRVMQDRPKQEFLIAIAGPLVNFLIALLLFPVLLWQVGPWEPGTISHVAARTGTSEPMAALMLLTRGMQRLSIEGMIGYLFFANIMLALFNLLPSFPMDGGRIFRALLATFLPYKLASTLAVRLGQALAMLLAIWGMRYNPGLLLIALFVFISGGAELQRVAMREVLARGQVATYMLRGLHPLYPQWRLYSARLLEEQSGQRAFPVMQEGRLLGLVTVREIRKYPPGITVGEAMIRNFSVLQPSGTLYDAQMILQGDDQFAAAVMEDNILLGLLSLDDIERAYHSLQRKPKVQIA